jgi:hypothetical protein
MADSMGESIYPGGPRFKSQKYHRRKSVLGKDWVPPRVGDVHAGVYCPIHRARHPYNGKGKVGRQFDKRNGKWIILWLCPITNDVIGEFDGTKDAAGQLRDTSKYLETVREEEDDEGTPEGDAEPSDGPEDPIP